MSEPLAIFSLTLMILAAALWVCWAITKAADKICKSIEDCAQMKHNPVLYRKAEKGE